MQNLPDAKTYEKELTFIPWGKLIREVLSNLSGYAHQNCRVLDLMCGTGWLLGELQKLRPDISCVGIDLDQGFIDFAKVSYPQVEFQNADASTWKTSEKFDVVLCTAGVHHLPDDQQEAFIKKISGLIRHEGYAIIADPFIGNYKDHKERMLAGAQLGYETLAASIELDAPPDVLKAMIDVLSNDIFMVEWKTSVTKRRKILSRYFTSIETHKTWPERRAVDFGDYYFVLSV